MNDEVNQIIMGWWFVPASVSARPTVRTKSQNEICSEHILVFRTYLTYYPAKQGCTSTFTAFMFVYLEVYILP